MLETVFLQNLLQKSLSHRGKLNALVEASTTLARGAKLYLTSIGRALANDNTPKSNIQKINRLIGNRNLNKDAKNIYRSINERILSNQKGSPLIAIDWSSIHSGTSHQVISATFCASGRGILCYEKIFEEHLYNTPEAHQIFLTELKSVLPLNCKPILITDAASTFGVEWFKQVKAMGWHWIGRTRHRKNYVFINGIKHTISSLYRQAKNKPKKYQNAQFTATHQHDCQVVTVFRKSKCKKTNRHPSRRSHRHATKKHQEAGKQPWVLIVDPELHLHENAIVNAYAKRMTIEERFRDTKDPKYGNGLLLSRTKSIPRLENLLLIDNIAKVLLWAVGTWAENNNLQQYFQANTVKSHRVLSIVRLGKEYIKSSMRSERWELPKIGLNKLLQLVSEHLVSVNQLHENLL